MSDGEPKVVVDQRRRAIMAELRAIRRRQETAAALKYRRRELLHEGRALGMVCREMAEACGVGESAILHELKRPLNTP